jgi:DNA-binding transcriptional LysR family regulator
MELRHLRYFIAVAEELHFGRAAARLNISAPTLSHQIGALESMLGAKLFTRRTKTAVALTHSGRRFLTEAQETLKQAAHAELVGRRAGRGDAGSISIGYVLSAACGGVLTTTLARFREIHPDVTFQMARVLTVEQYKTLADGSLDIGFTRTPHRYPTGLTGFIIDRQKFILAVPEKHYLASQKKITPAMLTNEGFVAASLESELGFWANLSAVAPPGAALRIVARGPDVLTVIALVASGAGLAVVSESLHHIAMPGVVYREVEGAHRTSDHIVAYRKNESEPVVKAFIKLLRANTRGV